MNPVECPALSSMIKALNDNGIWISTFTGKFEKAIERKDSNSIQLVIRLGYFATRIRMLKVHQEIEIFERSRIALGTYASIYGVSLKGWSYAIKSQRIKETDRLIYNESLRSILKEYFFYRLASTLEFGPRLPNIFGYDIVCYNDAIEFAMELCEHGLGDEKESFGEDLFEGMKKMHTLKMVHRDIKKENVAWSPHFRKWVFLDFGFATFLKEEIGRKSTTNFIGTYRNTTEELQRLYLLKEPGQVDFYYNDLFGLRKVVGNLKAELK